MSPLGLLRRAWRRLAQSERLARWIFGIDFLPLESHERYFDVTTPVLVRALRKRLTGESRLLDMGTGAFATVGLALWRRTGCRVLATDIHPEIVARARRSIEANRAPIRVIESRFFDAVDEEFDCVAFNIPYVPTRLVEDPDVPQPFAFQSDGGPEGTTVIEGFLDGFSRTERVAAAYLGINALLVPRAKVVPLIAGRDGLVLKEILRPLPLPVEVYVVERTRSESAPT